MGCWNKTCGISNLFIEAGEKVYVFALEQICTTIAAILLRFGNQ